MHACSIPCENSSRGSFLKETWQEQSEIPKLTKDLHGLETPPLQGIQSEKAGKRESWL